MNLVEAWNSDLRSVLGEEIQLVQAVRVGVFFTAVQISSGDVGVAFTPRDLSDTVCCPKTAASAAPAGRMLGRHAWELAEYALSPSPLRRSIGVAVLNALSALAIARRGVIGGWLQPGVNALKAAELVPEDRVTMVGAFIPFIKALKGQVAGMKIIDKHPGALKADEKSFWVPGDQAIEALSEASVVIMTGSALVEGGIDTLLEATSRARTVVLAGPTASGWPPTFFARGIDVLGGIQVRDPAMMLTLVSEGGSGYFFDQAAEKISIVKDAPTASIQMNAAS